MSGIETLRSTIIETCKPELIDEYTNVSRAVQRTIYEATSPPTSDDPGRLALQLFLPKAIDEVDKFGIKNPTTRMAMLIGAIAYRTYDHDNSGSIFRIPSSFKDIWQGTPLYGFAVECEEIVEEVVPNMHGEFVDINLEKMREKFDSDFKNGKPEHIVVTGLNASGKSKGIKFLEGILNLANVKATIIKMPRPDGPISETILPALRGDKKIKLDALQMFFLGDALDVDSHPDTLLVFDRHPRSEAIVYGPPETERLALASQEVFQGVYWTFILNRHPMASQMTVANRESKPRIFERDVETMTEQLIRFAKLTVLPGVFWITNDVPAKPSDPNWQVKISSDRLISRIFNTGVIQRYMVKQGLVKDTREANNLLIEKSLGFQSKVFGEP